MILDREWRYTFVNEPAARIFGRPRAELLGKRVWDLFPLIVGTDMKREMRRAANEQITCKFQGHDAAAERFYENRAFPTPEGGVAVYLRDVTERRQHEHHVERARAYAESIVTTVREPLLVLDGDLRVVSANRSFYATFKVGPAETEGRFVYDLGDGQWDIPRLRTLLEEIIPKNGWFDDFEVEHEFEHIGRKSMLLNARRFPPEGPFEFSSWPSRISRSGSRPKRKTAGARRCWPKLRNSPMSAVGTGIWPPTCSPGPTSTTASSAWSARMVR